MKFDFRKMVCGTIALVMTLSSFVCVQTVSAETKLHKLNVPTKSSDTLLTSDESKQDIFTILSGTTINKATQTNETYGIKDAHTITFSSSASVNSGVVQNAVKIDIGADQVPAVVTAVAHVGNSSRSGLGLKISKMNSAKTDFENSETFVALESDQDNVNIGSYKITAEGEYYISRSAATSTRVDLLTVNTYDADNINIIPTDTGYKFDKTGILLSEKGDGTHAYYIGSSYLNYAAVEASGSVRLVDNNTSGSTVLHLPIPEKFKNISSDNVLVYTGTIGDFNETGSKMSLLTFADNEGKEIVTLFNTNNKMDEDSGSNKPADSTFKGNNKLALRFPNESNTNTFDYYETDLDQTLLTNNTISYRITFDYNKKTVNLFLSAGSKSGSVTSNVRSNLSAVAEIKANTGNSGLRGYTLSDISIEGGKAGISGTVYGEAEFTPIVHENNVGSDKRDGIYRTAGAVNASAQSEETTEATTISYVYGNINYIYENNVVKNHKGTYKTPLSGVNVIIKDSEGKQVGSTKTDANGNYKFAGTDGKGLDYGTYTLSVTVAGKTTEEKDVAVNADNYTLKDITVDNTVKVTIQTDIKDFKTSIIVKTADGTDAFKLSDITYKRLAGTPEDENDDEVARLESITHTINMPSGTYSISLDSTGDNKKHSDRFTLTDSKGNPKNSFTINNNSSNQTVNLYLMPSKTSTESVEEKAKVAADALKGTVKRGQYKLFSGEGATKEQTVPAKIEFSDVSGNSVDEDVKAEALKGMSAEGLKIGDTDARLGIQGEVKDGSSTKYGGYVVFKIDDNDSFVTKIITSSQSCALINLDEKLTINGNRSRISTDSRFNTLTVTLSGGTYMLTSTAVGEAKIESIIFDYASPFEISQVIDIEEGEAEGTSSKLIVGKFDTNDNSDGALEGYSTFAILVSTNTEALKYAALNGSIAGKPTQTVDKNASSSDISTKDAQTHDTDAWQMEVPYIVGDQNTKAIVFRDDTTEVFKKILSDSGEELVPEDGKSYFYSVIAQNVTSDTPIYAIGAAKSKNADGSEGGNWMIQSKEPVQINPAN